MFSIDHLISQRASQAARQVGKAIAAPGKLVLLARAIASASSSRMSVRVLPESLPSIITSLQYPLALYSSLC